MSPRKEFGRREYNTYVSCKKYKKWYIVFRVVGVISVIIAGIMILGLVGRADMDVDCGTVTSQSWYIKYMIIGIVLGFAGYMSYCFGTKGQKVCDRVIRRVEK